MSRIKLLLSNFFVYGLGGIISKIIPILMVPIITRLFPSSFYFGLNDLTTTIISFFSAFAVMGMYDAMYRMFFEKDNEDFKKNICSSAFAFTMVMSTVIFALMLILQDPISKLFYTDRKYGNLVMLAAVSVLLGSTNTIISAPTRMQNKKKTFLIINTISPIIAYAIAIPMIISGHYILALPLASIISSVLIELIFIILNKKWFNLKRINWNYIKSMLKIAIPLLPNFIIYWIFSSSDKVMISNMLGPAQEGIYSVAGKIGQISNLIYTAFAGGWQFFAFSIMRDDDNVKVISKVFEVLAIISITTTILGTSIAKWGMELIFTNEYLPGYYCIPYLYLSPLLLMLFQIGTNQFLVIKKTWPNVIILSIGAVINVILNFVLIPIIGLEGASIATFVGYFISIVLCVIVLKKYKLFEISKKLILSVILFFIAFIVMRINDLALYYINIPVAVVYCLLLCLIYNKDIKLVINKIIKKKSNINKELIIESAEEDILDNTDEVNEENIVVESENNLNLKNKK